MRSSLETQWGPMAKRVNTVNTVFAECGQGNDPLVELDIGGDSAVQCDVGAHCIDSQLRNIATLAFPAGKALVRDGCSQFSTHEHGCRTIVATIG